MLSVGWALPARAQLVADFTANVTTGCAPLAVIFQDQSSGGTIISRHWTFGFNNNQSIGNNPSPSHAYPVAGTYTVTLTVSDGVDSATVTKTAFINVLANPTAAYSGTNLTGCKPLTVNFQDQSTPGGAPIATWFWDFGDGNTSGTQSPTHTYNNSGSFSPTLIVTDTSGCTDNISQSNFVTVSDAPDVSFTTTGPRQACVPPLTVNFLNTTTGSGTITYVWDFGDGSATSTQTSPSHTYTALGAYDVTLTATSNSGCVTTLTLDSFVVIANVDADFSVTNSPVCVGSPVQVNNTTVGASGFSWSWGDGTSSSGQNPTHIYASPGVFTITLTGVSGNCSDTHSETVTVEEVIADFAAVPDYVCELPATIQYNDLSTSSVGNIVSWEWNFWAPPPLTETSQFIQNPSRTITDRGFEGVHQDTLIVTSSNGCVGAAVLPRLVVDLMEPQFTASIQEGCVPLTVNFTDFSIPTDSFPITNWSWDFDDGTSSNQQSPQHTFNTTGEFMVTLTITNGFGCVEVSDSLLIRVGTKPTAAFTSSPDTSCASAPVAYVDQSQPAALVNFWSWSFSDGVGQEGQNVFINHLDTGWIQLTLIVGYNGCRDTISADSAVYILGPLVNLTPILDCDTPLARQFVGTYIDTTGFVWNFGDGNQDSIHPNPFYTYGATGDYQPTITGFNSETGCTYSSSRNVFIRDLVADFTLSDSTGCVPLVVTTDGTSSQDVNAPEWDWDFGNGQQLFNTALGVTIYQSPGTYPVTLTVLDINGCGDTLVKDVIVSDPQANFNFTFQGGCNPPILQFNDLSTSDTAIVQWSWNFGDGSPLDTAQNPLHQYPGPGNYVVVLNVTDAFGCTHTTQQSVSISQPLAAFSMSDTTICAGTIISFNNFSIGNGLTYSWDFGDGQGSNFSTPFHVFNDTGTFTVTLAVSDNIGCTDTARISTVQVQATPQARFTTDSTIAPCYPFTVTFTDTSITGSPITRKWDFGDGSPPVVVNGPTASRTYTAPGNYTVKLVVTTSFGCADSVIKVNHIRVRGPVATFSLDPDTICPRETVCFSMDTAVNVVGYSWSFGDGLDTTLSGQVTNVCHQYFTRGPVSPVVIYYDSGQVCTISYFDTLYVDEVTARFTVTDDSIGCVPLVTTMADASVRADNWQWDFGDGGTAGTQNPAHTFDPAGTYPVTLVVSNATTGCADTLSKNVVVHPLPTVTVSDDDFLCEGDTVPLDANGTAIVNWQWFPGLGLSNDTVANPLAFPDTTTEYRATGTDTNGCRNSDSLVVEVQQVPTLTILPSDTTIIIGEVIPVMLLTDFDLEYSWSPADGLSCTDCPNPLAQPLVNTVYTLTVRDLNGCFEVSYTFPVEVTEQYSVDLPDAFTPNGDGVNDRIFVRGWGIKEVLEWRIFNRWGQEVFFASDKLTGWDGTYRGEPQNMDTYTYVLRVLHYDDQEASLKGYISLLR